MAFITEIEKRYGNGCITTHRRTSNSYRNAVIDIEESRNADNYRHYICNDEEKERLRTTKTRSNAKQRALSYNFTHFATFTTSNRALAMDGKALLNAVCDELKKQGLKYHAQLELFSNLEEFHVHCLLDNEFIFTSWIENYGFSNKKGTDLGEHYEDLEKNLYCEPIYSTQENCADYINKGIAKTKAKLKELYNNNTHVYKSNVKKKDATTIIRVIDTETGEIHTVFDNSSIQNDVNNRNDNTYLNEINSSNIIFIDIYVSFNKEKTFISLNSLLNYKKDDDLLAIVTNADFMSAFAPVAHSLYDDFCDDFCCKNDEEKEKDVLKVEKRTNIAKNIILKSYTGTKGVPIPLKNRLFLQIFTNFLLNYIGWVENIPINNNRK